METWQQTPDLRALGETELTEMATRVVVGAANLTCGTTMGIVSHPLLAVAAQRPWDPITRMPHWDVLIVDEASKTLIQEFLVPALMARRWVVVGDIQQLPPFNDRADIVANLRSLTDDQGQEVFPAHHQRACLLRYWLQVNGRRRTGARWLIAEAPSVLDQLGQELLALDRPRCPVDGPRGGPDRHPPGPVPRGQPGPDPVPGIPPALALAACDWVLVAS